MTFLGTLATVLIVLKLAELIPIGWVAVLAPIWVPFALVGMLYVTIGVFMLLIVIMDKFK